MSRGELIIDDNQVKETALPASGDWAAEYQQQFDNRHTWAHEFLNDKACINAITVQPFLLFFFICSQEFRSSTYIQQRID